MKQEIEIMVSMGIPDFIAVELTRSIAKKAFKKGENWGCAYQGWFTPSEEDTEIRFEELFNDKGV